jgi:hypothetical protein
MRTNCVCLRLRPEPIAKGIWNHRDGRTPAAASKAHHDPYVSRALAGFLPAPAGTGKLRLRERVAAAGAGIIDACRPTCVSVGPTGG